MTLKKNTNYKKEGTTMGFTEHYQVIDGSEIESFAHPDIKFKGRWESEDFYKNLIEKSQPYIKEYLLTGTIKEPVINSIEDIEKFQEERDFLCGLKDGFFGISCISAKQLKSGKYEIIVNGRHRAYVAKKYGLKLIIKVIEEERDHNETVYTEEVPLHKPDFLHSIFAWIKRYFSHRIE